MVDMSITIIALNEEALLPGCLAAARRSADAAAPLSVEIVVVDNGSTDGTARAAAEGGADAVVSEPRRGIAAARLAALAASRGDLVAFLDADTVLPRGWVAAAAANFSNPSVVAASGPLRFYDMPRRYDRAAALFYAAARIAHRALPTVQGGNYAARRAALTSTGALESGIEFWGEDTAAAVALSGAGKIVLDPRMVVLTSGRRLRGQGAARTVFSYVANYLAVHALGRPVSRRRADYR